MNKQMTWLITLSLTICAAIYIGKRVFTDPNPSATPTAVPVAGSEQQNMERIDHLVTSTISLDTKGIEHIKDEIKQAQKLLTDLEHKKISREQRLTKLFKIKEILGTEEARPQPKAQTRPKVQTPQQAEQRTNRLEHRLIVFEGTDARQLIVDGFALLLVKGDTIGIGQDASEALTALLEDFKKKGAIEQVLVKTSSVYSGEHARVVADYLKRAYAMEALLVEVTKPTDNIYPIEIEVISGHQRRQAQK